MTVADLAERSGIPGRTIRFYITRGLLPGPSRAGRGAPYTAEHLDRLAEIQTLQNQGLTLAEIGRRLQPAPVEIEPTAWWQFPVADDITVWVSASASPWRHHQIRGAIAELAARLHKGEMKHADTSAGRPR